MGSIDPEKAIEYASATYPHIAFSTGTADDLAFGDGAFDMVVLGFCLYLTDPEHHFRTAWQTDRVLSDGGVIVIKDFVPPAPYKNRYAHLPGVYARKMAWANMFDWHPSYTLLSRTYLEHGDAFSFAPDERVSIDILRKDIGAAFPDRPASL